MKKIIFLLILFLSVGIYSQTQFAVRIIDASGAPVTGLTSANIKFRISPFGAGDVLTIPVTEKGSQGNYICTGFTTFQLVKLFIDGVEQEWFGQQYSGDPDNTFVNQAGTETITGDKTFTGALIATDVATFTEPYISSTSTVPTSDMLVWKSWVEANTVSGVVADSFFIIRNNRLIVDSRLAVDIAGKQYNDIKTAMDWIYSNGSPSANNRWTIYIIPSNITSTGYASDFTWYDYIDLVGMGQVLITNTINIPPYSIFTRTGSNRVRAENINFYSYDANLSINLIQAFNCNFKVELDNYSPNLNIQNSQLVNCGLYVKGLATTSVVGANRLMNCYGNSYISWTVDDDIYGYTVMLGDEMEF